MEKEIVGMKLVGDYIACSNGRIFKLNYKNNGRTVEVGQHELKSGYLQVAINGKKMYSHRFIAMCFIPNPNNLPEVNHKNEVKSDNRVENLEWCDRKYNLNYGTRNERAAKNRIGKHRITKNGTYQERKLKFELESETKKLKKIVLQFTKGGEFIATYSSIRDAELKTGIHYSHISHCCHGKRKSAGGFVWRRAD